MSEHDIIEFVTAQRWFGSKTRNVIHATVVDRAPLSDHEPSLELQLVEVRFDTGTHETYQLLTDDTFDALADPRQVRELVHMIRTGAKVPASEGVVEFAIGQQSGIRGHYRTTELNNQPAVEIEPENPVVRITPRVRHPCLARSSIRS